MRHRIKEGRVFGWILALAVAFPSVGTAAGDGDDQNAVSRQDITIHGNGPAGPVLSPLPPTEGKPVADEVIHSLGLYKNNFKVSGTMIRIPGTKQRLSHPFPDAPYLVFYPKAFRRPYDHWAFEVMADGVTIWRTQGTGMFNDPPEQKPSPDEVMIGSKRETPASKLSWDGTDAYGAFVARVGQQYSFRFVGFAQDAEYAVASEPIELTSVTVPEGLSGVRLEVSAAALFGAGEAGFLEGASAYLQVMADRLRRIDLQSEPYRFVLYQKEPQSALSLERAKRITNYFSKALLVNSRKVSIDVLSTEKRGDVLACVIPILPQDNNVIQQK